jgi:alanine-glyoxylate transaminase/(R)-3-amino-2-methylpropionate-pyruvate transaminase
MAKGIGNGIPLAAVVTTPEIAKALVGKIHFNTFGGNPIACAVGKAVLETIDEEGIQEKALTLGKQMYDGFLALQAKYGKGLIGDVRGRGLMWGIELIKDAESKEPNADATAKVFEACKDMGLLIGKGGLYGNVLRIKPVMCLTPADVEFMLAVIDKAFSQL